MRMTSKVMKGHIMPVYLNYFKHIHLSTNFDKNFVQYKYYENENFLKILYDSRSNMTTFINGEVARISYFPIF